MKDIFKLFAIALLTVLIIMTGMVFSIPKLRQRIFGKSSIQTAEMTGPEKVEIQTKSEKGDLPLASVQVRELVQELKEKEKNLEFREKNLKLREDRFKGREDYILAREKEIERMLKEIAQYIPQITDAEKKNLKKMAKMFETLSPDTANPLIAQMPDKTVVKVLSFMKPRNSAKLLSGYATLGGEASGRAARLTEMLKKLVIQ